jgi:hypothetical protein
LASGGVAVKVLTGDNELVAAKICRDVGIRVEQPLVGDEVERMTDEALAAAAASATLLARLTPAQKERMVRLLRGRGHVVGFLGDGINDAPALRAADVGISVDTAVDIARESADCILLGKDLRVLEEGERGHAVRTDDAAPDSHHEPALRLLPGADSRRRRRSRTGGSAAAVGDGPDRPVHPLPGVRELAL